MGVSDGEGFLNGGKLTYSKSQKNNEINILPGLQPNLRLTVIALNFDAGTLALITMEGRHNDSRLS